MINRSCITVITIFINVLFICLHLLHYRASVKLVSDIAYAVAAMKIFFYESAACRVTEEPQV